MIYCPKCKTANRDGSRFCNECGERLGTQTSPKCPECGALNPIQNIFCSECGARLFSSSTLADSEPSAPSVKGLSLPTKSPQGGEEATSDEAESELPEAAGSALQEEPLPDWLRDLRASLPEEGDLMEDDEASDPPAERRAPVFKSEPEPEPESEMEPDAGEAPDWLAELQAAATGEPVDVDFEPDEEEVGDAPAWLAQLRTAGLESAPVDDEQEAAKEGTPDLPEVTPPDAKEVDAEEGLSDWLADLRQAGPEAALTEPEPEAEVGEVPDWLADLRQAEPESAPAEPEPEAEEGEAPDWLAQLRQAEPEPEPEAEVGEVPDWLADLRQAEPEAALTEPEPEAEGGEAPDWLREFQTEEEPEGFVAAADGAISAPEDVKEKEREPVDLSLDGEEEEEVSDADQKAPAPEGSGPPEWLTELAGPATEEATPGPALADAELPDWLVPRPLDEGEILEKAAIPEWLLALKPRTSEPGEQEPGPIQTPDEVAEETGLLAGVKGALPAEMLIAAPQAARAKKVLSDEVQDTPQSRLFAQVVSQPPAIAPKALGRREPATLSRLGRWLIALLLIAAVALPLLLNQPLWPRPIPPAPSTEALYRHVDGLKPGDVVLLSFDYDPTTSGEMNIVARTLIEHLLERHVRLVAVSLLPAGPATAQALLEELAAEDQYANLGYIPGQVAAVRLLARSWDAATSSDWQGVAVSDLEVLEGVSDLSDVALVIELAASQDTLRWWIEQAGEPHDIHLGAGVSAAVEPVARAYYETNSQQLAGVVSGVMGAAAYDGLGDPGASSSEFSARLDAQAAGTLVLILVLVLGNIIYPFRRPKGEGRG